MSVLFGDGIGGRRRWPSGLAVLLAAMASGCSDETGVARIPATSWLTAVVDIAVDADRDGTIDFGSAAEQAHEEEWSARWGASFLCNLDDDDGDGVRDAESAEVDGELDALDLARIRLAPWPDALPGSVGTLTIDAAAAPHVRIHRLGPEGSWSAALGLVGPCGAGGDASCAVVSSVELPPEALPRGAELGIEGVHFVGLEAASGWDGMVELGWTIRDARGTALRDEQHPTDDGDRARMRAAPWTMLGNHDAVDAIYSSDASDDFVAALGPVLAEAGVPLRTIPWSGPEAWTDQWTQDLFQFGSTTIPAADGGVQGMRVALPRPYSYGTLPLDWLERNYLGPDRAVVAVYRQPSTGNTYDSFGNHELLPPSPTDETFPLGRIVVGVPEQMLPETKAFYQAQGVQAPIIGLDTSWLAVGHVDEVVSFVPASTARGWKLLVASPAACLALLQGWQQQGHGAERMFVGKQSYNGVDASVAIDELLDDPDIAAWNQDAQARIDELLDGLATTAGLDPADVIEVPVCFAQDQGMLALVPSAINSLVLGDRFVCADPFGPSIDGEDGFERDLRGRLGTVASELGADGQGLRIAFVDDWDWYHVLFGEVHCATNADGPPSRGAWWEVAP
jgi:protein-arginine deiminase